MGLSMQRSTPKLTSLIVSSQYLKRWLKDARGGNDSSGALNHHRLPTLQRAAATPVFASQAFQFTRCDGGTAADDAPPGNGQPVELEGVPL